MLKIKAPIELKCVGSFVPKFRSFGEKITGGYTLINASIEAEDLMHVVTSPPEVYIAAGEGGTIYNENNISINNENRLDIINQLLNRILISGENSFTYQDRVYITSILNKLGIKDVKQFMEQVNRLKLENYNTTRLVDFYWQHLEELTELSENIRNEQGQNVSNVDKSSSVTEQLTLHQDIFNRLKTGMLYQVIQNFQDGSRFYPTYVRQEDLRLSEHRRLTRNIFLNRMENYVRGEESPLVFLHSNHYELPTAQEESQPSEARVEERITSAVLLQVIDNLIENTLSGHTKHEDIWYDVSRSLYMTSENTFNRMQLNVKNNHFTREESRAYDLTQDNILIARQEENVWNVEENIDLITEQLRLIEQKNTENREHFYNTINQLQQPEKKKKTAVSREQQKKESLMALQNPEQLMELYREQARQEEAASGEQDKTIMDAFPEDTRRIYEILERYVKAPETLRGIVHAANPELAMKELEYLSTEKVTDHVVDDIQHEEIRELSENVMERWQEGTSTRTVIREPSEQVSFDEGPVDLIHSRETEYLTSEDLTELVTDKLRRERLRETSESLTDRWQEGTTTHTTVRELSEEIYEDAEPLSLTHVREREHLTTEELTDRSSSELRRERIKEISENVIEHYTEGGSTHTTVRESEDDVYIDGEPLTLTHVREKEYISTEDVTEVVSDTLRREQLKESEEHTTREVTDRSVSDVQREQIREISENVIEKYTERTTSGVEIRVPSEEIYEGAEPLNLTHVKEREYLSEEDLKERTISETSREIIRELSENVIERWQEGRTGRTTIRNFTEEVYYEEEPLSLVHREEERSRLNEEVVQELLEENRIFRNTVQVKNETVENVVNTRNVTTTDTTREIQEQLNHITASIQRGAFDRIDEISDAVYNQLERRLSGERRRRGM